MSKAMLASQGPVRSDPYLEASPRFNDIASISSPLLGKHTATKEFSSMNTASSGLMSSFNSLPYEIREQIWIATLVPRLIYIHPYPRFEPSPHGPEDDEIIDTELRTVCVRFNYSLHTKSAIPAEAFAAYKSSVVSDTHLVRKTYAESEIEILENDRTLSVRSLAFKSADPPSALYVCQESRATALRNGYILAFKGVDLWLDGEDKKYWHKNHLSDKGIWINFDTDLIMLDTMHRIGTLPKHLPQRPLLLLSKWAPDDVRRIKYLALGGNFSSILRTLRGKHSYILLGGQRQSSQWEWWVGMNYDNVEEIWIDDRFKVEGSEEHYYDEQVRLWGFQKPATRFLLAINSGKSKLPHWTKPLPQMKVVRGKDWHLHFDG